MHSPVFTSLDITGIKTSDAYQPAVYIQWNAPGGDSPTIREFVILRKKQSSDSVFSVMHYGIPDSVSGDYDVLDPKDFPVQGVYAKRWYRIFAIDVLGRPGDTSAPDSIRLCWAPRPGAPVDTINQNIFTWYTIEYLAGYFTYLFLWSDTRGLVWTSPKPNEPSYGHETLDSFLVKLPDALYPLARGVYWYGLKVEIPGENIQTLAVQEFYAP
jgi:hypothetical protein